MAVHEIKIYGDIVPFKWFNDGSEYDLKDLNSAISGIEFSEGDELIVGIHTFGGDTSTAFGIYNILLRLKNQKKINLTTRIDGWCASSGVIILLVGDKRIGNAYAEPFVHNAWTYLGFSTTADEAKKAYEDLAKVDNQIATLYAERTNISVEKAIELMNSENYITAEDSLAFGFFTELENVYASENSLIFNSLRENNSQNRKIKIQNNMSKNNEAKKKDLWTQIENFFKGTKNKIVFTADNSELDFYELADDAIPKAKDGETAGDKAKFDGKPAGENNNGEYVMPSGETYKFVGEELTEIVPKEDDNSNSETEIANLKTENENLKAEIENIKNEKTALNNKVLDAERIIKNFKELENDDDEEDEKRNPRTPEPTKRNLFKNLK